MKKFFLLLFLLKIIHNTSTAQSSVGVSYIFITKFYKNEIEKPSLLVFSKQKSVFIYNKGTRDGIVSKPYQIMDSNGNSQTYREEWYEDTTGTVIYKDFENKDCIIREIIWTQPYLTREPSLPLISWQIQPDTKK
ncbi:MAG: hypothetical protein QM669_02120 [Siphonobacter sp.]